MPPRHGKSEFLSKYLPAWYLGTYPDRRVILASYSDTFAAEWGGKARDLLEQHGHLFGVKVRSDSSARDRWEIAAHAGGMVTAGAGGGLTGRGGHLVVVDDPVKSQAEALSDVIRERTHGWFRNVLLPRLEPGGSVILVMTRWHQDDLAG